MNLNDQHKAILITFLISGTVLLFIFNLSIKEQPKLITESYYEIEPEKELTKEEIKVLEALEKINKAETNDAFNETQKTKRFAQAYKTIAPPEDYVPESVNSNNENLTRKTYEVPENSKLNNEELSKYNKVKDLLKQQQSNGNNSNSSIRFSLKDRTKVHIPIPIYLCEVGGKIVINITVNANGNVIDAYANTASNSKNKCLVEHAINYAKQSQFSSDNLKEKQLGTITFFFISK